MFLSATGRRIPQRQNPGSASPPPGSGRAPQAPRAEAHGESVATGVAGNWCVAQADQGVELPGLTAIQIGVPGKLRLRLRSIGSAPPPPGGPGAARFGRTRSLPTKPAEWKLSQQPRLPRFPGRGSRKCVKRTCTPTVADQSRHLARWICASGRTAIQGMRSASATMMPCSASLMQKAAGRHRRQDLSRRFARIDQPQAGQPPPPGARRRAPRSQNAA